MPCPDQQGGQIAPLHPLQVSRRADHRPVPAQLVLGDISFEALTDICVDSPVQTTSEKYMETWLKIPTLHPRIVGGGDKRHARAEAGAQDADPLVPLLQQPVDARAGVDDRLAAGVDGPADVARAVIVGALQSPPACARRGTPSSSVRR